MVAAAYNLETVNSFAGIMEILVTVQSARSLLPLELHNLHESDGKRLTGVHLGHQLG